jgi:hypothetical protein
MSSATQESSPSPRWRRCGRSTMPLTNTAAIRSPTHPIQALLLSEEDDDEPAPEPSPGIHIEPHNQAR